MKRTMARARYSLLPSNPVSLQDISFDNFNMDIVGPYGSFLLEDSGPSDPQRFLVLGTERSLAQLATCTTWFFDGTFQVCPALFYQVVTLLGVISGQAFPLVYGLLPNKTKTTYQRFLLSVAGRMLRLPLPTYPKMFLTLITDFETGIIPAIKCVMPYAHHRGCFFHFSQAIYRAIIRMGYSVLYRSDPEIRIKFRMFLALGLVPISHVHQYLGYLYAFVSCDATLLRFYGDYFFPTWIQGTPGHLWNWFGVEYRTNNVAESHHSALRKKFTAPHPVFFRFMTVLKDYHLNTLRDMSNRELGGPLPPKNQKFVDLNIRLLTLQGEFHAREPIAYMRAVAHSVPGPHFAGSEKLE